MKTNIDQLFYRDTPIPHGTGTYTSGASTLANSSVLDVRRHGTDRTKDLVVRVHVNNAKDLGTGVATVTVETSDSGTSGFTAAGAAVTLSKAALDGNAEILVPYPQKPKQFLRLSVKVTTAFPENHGPVLYAGLDADDEYGIDPDVEASI